MNTADIAGLYRRYCDESDVTLVGNTDAASDLRLAYDEFRRWITQHIPWYYATTRNVAVVATAGDFSRYDLRQNGANPTGATTPSLLGAVPNAAGTPIARLDTLLAIEVVDTTGAPKYRMDAASSLDAMYEGGNKYFWRGDHIGFPRGFVETVRLHYVPQQAIGIGGVVFDPTWASVIAVGAGVFLDDMHPWHDLIAMMAYGNYAIQDAADNIQLLRRLEERKRAFQDYLERAQFQGTSYIQRVLGADEGLG